ncbi:MAG TPA: glycosyltransferase family 4 protein [Tepidisphaeraceae bacterium]|nr:glycosyltransferase family 4 protein [Tepidisphaeraceae bacterium]
MRIGLVTYEYPPQPGLGGVGTYAFRLAGALAGAGHEVVVLAGPASGPEIPLENVTVHRLAARYEPSLGFSAFRWVYWQVLSRMMEKAHPIVWHWMRWNLASADALLDIHRKTPLDVIEAPEHAANGLFAGRLRKWPTVVRIHGPWDLFFGINRTEGTAMNRMLTSLERKSTNYAQVVTTPSHTMSAFMHAKWGMRHAPRVVPNFMDVPELPAPLPDPAGPQRIVVAGRIERFKGQDVLVKAFARIADKHPRAELHVIGPDQWSAKESFASVVDQLVPDADARRRVVLTGPVTLTQVQEELRNAAAAVVCSSGFESFSFSTLEAMAAARPIVGSRVGAIPELLDSGNCGLLAAPGNVAQFADGLDAILSDRALAQRLASAAHDRARRRYDTAVAIPQMVRAFKHAREIFHGVEALPRRGAVPALLSA